MPPSAMIGMPAVRRGAVHIGDGGELRHADARDDARRADRAGPDADLDRVGAGLRSSAAAPSARRDVAGDDLRPGERLRISARRSRARARVAVRGVDADDVDAGGEQRRPRARPDRARCRPPPHAQAAELVLGRVRVRCGLLDVLDGDEPVQLVAARRRPAASRCGCGAGAPWPARA